MERAERRGGGDVITPEQLFDQVPAELAAYVMCDPIFAQMPVVVAEKGNVRAEMDRLQATITCIGGKIGTALIVLPLVADDAYDEVGFGPMKLFSSFQVLENVELNHGPSGLGLSCRYLARHLVKIMKPLRLGGLTTDWVCDKPCIEPGIVKLASSELQSRLVNFYTWEADTEPMQQVASLAFAQAGNQVAISCATAGAQIWYTLDQTFPAPPSAVPGSTAQLYSGPIAVPPGGMIRGMGIMGGMISSQVEWAAVEVV